MSEGGDGAAERPDSPSPSLQPAPPPPAPTAPATLREDQITNAVAFLSHPKVRASAASSKQDFLRRKGLTEAEIDEAFRRVPTDAPAAAPAAPPATAPSAVAATLQHLQPQLYAQQPGQQPGVVAPYQPPQPQGMRWTQIVLGAGFTAATAYAAKSLLWPYMEGAYHSWRGTVRTPPRPRRINGGDEAVEGEEVSPDATRAVAQAIQAQTAELRGSIDSIKGLVATLEAGHKERSSGCTDVGDGLTVAELRAQLNSFSQTLQEIASPGPSSTSAKLESELGEIKGLLAELLRSPSGSRTPRGAGSKDAGSGEATPLSVTSALAARGLADEATAPPAVPAAVLEPAEQAAAQRAAPLPSSGSPAPPPHPASYLEVLEMLERGQTPPGIRTDINDKPPNPLATPAEPKLKPRPKPWERGSGAGGSGSSISSLGSLPASSAAPAAAAGHASAGLPTAAEAAAPAAAAGHASAGLPAAAEAAAPAEAASTPLPSSPAGGSYAEAAARALSSVRAPSPADEAGTEAQLPQQQEPCSAAGGQQGKPSSFQSPKRAASIFEAVAPAPESPNIITGRLSPAATAPPARSGSSGSLGGGPVPHQASTFSEMLAAAEQRVSSSGAAVTVVQEGSGIGRPISRGWKPPPIPAPTLSGGSGSEMNLGSPPIEEAAATPANNASGAGQAANGPAANGTAVRSPSAASLGADFASA